MARLVELFIHRDRSGAGGVAGDHGLGTEFLADDGPDAVGIIGAVGNDVVGGLEALEQGLREQAVMDLPGADLDAQRVAERIDAGMDLGCQAAFRAADAVSLSPPFAPAASAWTFEIVASIMTYSKSGSCAKALKRFSHTPLSVHRRKREWTVAHFPSSGGRSRHGAQLRAIHSTASTNSRLSSPLRPRSVLLPGTSCSIRAHCASLKVLLLKIASVFDLESEITRKGNLECQSRTKMGQYTGVIMTNSLDLASALSRVLPR